MATKKKVLKKKAPKVTSRTKILKYCEVMQERGHAGNTLIFGKHKYRLNRLLKNLTDAECDRTFKNMQRMGLSAHIKKMEKGIVHKRKPVVTTEPKPCECGCRAVTRRGSRFLPGHDAKLKSILKKRGTPKAKKELKSRGWA